MGIREEIVSIATGELGYKEKASSADLDSKTANAGTKNYSKYGKWYGSDPGPWCAKFICWVFNEAKVLNLIKKTASCSSMMSYFKNNDAFLVRGNNKPKIGDIIFINWSQGSSPDHVGIIAKTDDTYTYTIEGNRSNSVASARYKYSDKRVIGYGLPNFIDSEDATDTPAIVDEEYEIGTYTVISKTWLNVRTGPGYTYDKKEFKNLSSKVQKAILKAKRMRLNGLVKDMSVEVTQIKNSIWVKLADGWICLDFCKKELS